MTRARRPRGRARVVRGGESCEDNFYRAFVALMGTRRRERAREGTVNANEACARAKREFSLTNVDADRARTRDAGTRRERDREKTHETLAVHGVRERARDGAFSTRMKVSETVDS